VLARIKGLFRNLAIYGLGDVATSIVSLLLLPVYTRYLSPEDYGVIAMLLIVEAVAKIGFRWGVDTAFMRMYHDCVDQASRQLLASTIFWFLVAANGTLLALGVAGSEWLSERLFDDGDRALLIVLMLANTFVAGFYFIPLQVLRIDEKSRTFIALVFGRSAGTLIVRLVLVIGAGMGVMGVVLADVLVTAVFTLIMVGWFAPLIRPMFSTPLLKDALGFGLPRIPHSFAHQVISVADRYFLKRIGTLADVGLYSIGATFGLGLKLFLSAFEYAWTPFFLGVMKEPDARTIYSKVSTYVIAVLVLLVTVLCAIATDLVRLTTAPAFHAAATVTPWIALGVMFQGLYLVGSIGLIITRRTSRYPLATGIAAAASVTSNVLLIPRYGSLGAAWSQTIAYATLALVTVVLSWRVYPIPYEWSRLARIAAAGTLAFVASSVLPARTGPVLGILLNAAITSASYAALLFVGGFFHPGELRVLNGIRQRVTKRTASPAPQVETGGVEMAGELADTPSEPPVSADSRAPRR
jgi:O-antigen/teichoic acid export membrane protein